jgi:hypothetical protein
VRPLVSVQGLAALLCAAAPLRAEPPLAQAREAALGKRGEASVTLGVVGERRTERSELAAYVGVTVPLERLVARRSTDAAISAAERQVAAADSVDDVDGAREPSGAAAGAPSDGDSADAVLPALPPELLARLARDTVAAAGNARHLAEREGDLDGLATRARWSALLPEVRVRAARSRDDSLHMQPTLDDPYRYSTIGGDGLLVEAQATFRLNRLVFADEEVAIERLRILRERVGEDRAERVTGRLIRWHRALSHERNAPDPERRGRAALARVEAQMELDVLTDGWFGEQVRRLGLETSPVERSDPAPKNPAELKPAPKSNRVSRPSALAGLDARPASATSASPCLPKLATDSKTFCGASMR